MPADELGRSIRALGARISYLADVGDWTEHSDQMFLQTAWELGGPGKIILSILKPKLQELGQSKSA